MKHPFSWVMLLMGFLALCGAYIMLISTPDPLWNSVAGLVGVCGYAMAILAVIHEHYIGVEQ